jgi:hypothetical protein
MERRTEPGTASLRDEAALPWKITDIPWASLRRESVEQDDVIFYLVLSASFIESATDTYTGNLIAYFQDDPEVTAWLRDRWEQEELQHGAALRRYAETAWPHIDWQAAYDGFFQEFCEKCADDGLESSRCLETVSRCIVEMGTASYYSALSRLSPEPVLMRLATLIRGDEVRHYKHFYRYFRAYWEREHPGRLDVLRAIFRRIRMMDSSDSIIALKHVYRLRYPGAAFDPGIYRKLQRQIRLAMGANFPVQMSAKMALKPLDLNPTVQKAALSIITPVARYILGASRQTTAQLG